jgi:hypothetical protein
MEARPVISDIPKSVMRNPNSNEAEEFKRLILESSAEHKEKTVKLLNAMFNEDITRKEAILLFKNNSDCNIVLRIRERIIIILLFRLTEKILLCSIKAFILLTAMFAI